MAQEVYGFYDSTMSDEREYSEVEMSLFARLISKSTGVRTLEKDLIVTTADDGLRVKVGYGEALVQGYWYALQDDGGAPYVLALNASNSQARIDRIVLRLDLATNARRPVIAVISGSPALAPTPPALTRTGVVYEISLAQVRVAVGAALIASGDITDERGDEGVCGTLDEALRRARSYTAADVLTKLKTVGGAGSGLDADLFKGQAVIPISLGGTGGKTQDEACTNIGAFRVRVVGTGGDCNNYTIAGQYASYTWQNRPTGAADNQGILIVMPYNTGWLKQIFHTPHDAVSWMRSQIGGTWTPWTVCAGAGLDATYLNGQPSAYFTAKKTLLWSGAWGASGSSSISVANLSAYSTLIFGTWTGQCRASLGAEISVLVSSTGAASANFYSWQILRSENYLLLGAARYTSVSSAGALSTGTNPNNMIVAIWGVND